jgi:hypothetical protein
MVFVPGEWWHAVVIDDVKKREKKVHIFWVIRKKMLRKKRGRLHSELTEKNVDNSTQEFKFQTRDVKF